MFKVLEESGEHLQKSEEDTADPENKDETAKTDDYSIISKEWPGVCKMLTEMKERLDNLDTKLEGRMENLEKIILESKTSVEKLQENSEEAESLSQTLLMLYEENSVEIRNLQSGFHEIGNKAYETQQTKGEKIESLMEEHESLMKDHENLMKEHENLKKEQDNLMKEQEKFKNMNDEWNLKFETLDKEMRRLKSRQENTVVDAMRSSMECMVCLETPSLPLYVCSHCSKMVGCFQCCSQLQTCANCRADLPSNKQPLRGLEVLGLFLKSGEQS